MITFLKAQGKDGIVEKVNKNKDQLIKALVKYNWSDEDLAREWVQDKDK